MELRGAHFVFKEDVKEWDKVTGVLDTECFLITPSTMLWVAYGCLTIDEARESMQEGTSVECSNVLKGCHLIGYDENDIHPFQVADSKGLKRDIMFLYVPDPLECGSEYDKMPKGGNTMAQENNPIQALMSMKMLDNVMNGKGDIDLGKMYLMQVVMSGTSKLEITDVVRARLINEFNLDGDKEEMGIDKLMLLQMLEKGSLDINQLLMMKMVEKMFAGHEEKKEEKK